MDCNKENMSHVRGKGTVDFGDSSSDKSRQVEDASTLEVSGPACMVPPPSLPRGRAPLFALLARWLVPYLGPIYRNIGIVFLANIPIIALDKCTFPDNEAQDTNGPPLSAAGANFTKTVKISP